MTRTIAKKTANGPLFRCAEPSSVNTFFLTRHPDQAFCCEACRKKFNNRQMVRGAKLMAPAMAWRAAPRDNKDRQAKKAAAGIVAPKRKPHLGDMANLVDQFRREDKEMRAKAFADAKAAKEAQAA